MKKNLFYSCLMVIAILFTSCAKEPSITKIEATVDGYTVTFSAIVTDADSYSWDFGDDQTSTDKAPVHTYISSGEYTVTLKVEGKGGSASLTKDVEILPSFTEMLTGGPEAANGKTWVLSRGYVAGVDGGGVINNDMWVVLGSAENALDLIGMGKEYDNEFTFFHDGKYVVDVKNDTALVATLFGIYGGEVTLYTAENNQFGFNLSSYTAPESATWTLHEDPLVMVAVTDPSSTAAPAPQAEVTISGKKWISLSEGAYFGILDFPTTRKFVVKELTPDKMTVAIPVCAYWADPVGSGSVPTYFYHLTFVPKN